MMKYSAPSLSRPAALRDGTALEGEMQEIGLVYASV